MAGYGYMNQGYTDNWNRRSNGEYGYPDEEGRRGPIISYRPNNSSESYYVADYGYRSPTIVEPVKDYYGVKPSGPIHDETNRLTRPGLLSATNWPPNSSSTGYGEYTYLKHNDWNKLNGNTICDESLKDYYRRNDGFTEPTITNQYGWERPGHKAYSHETNDIGKKAVEVLKETAISSLVTGAAPQPHKGHSHEKNGIGEKAMEILKETAMSSLVTAAAPQPHKGQSHETNDIGKKAVEILKETAMSSLVTAAAPQPRFTLPASMVPKRDIYAKINNSEAVGRYGSFNLSSRPF